MKSTARGLTLVEIAIAVTIIGFVAAFALPAYRDHTIREKVAEVVATARAAQGTVDEYAGSSGELPTTAAISLPFATSRYVRASTWAGTARAGAITVSTRPTTSQDETELNSKVVVLTATYNPLSRTVDWACGNTAATTVPARYLPPDCR